MNEYVETSHSLGNEPIRKTETTLGISSSKRLNTRNRGLAKSLEEWRYKGEGKTIMSAQAHH